MWRTKQLNGYRFVFFSPCYSVQLEEPFNILPLRQYSDGVRDGVDFIASAYSDSNNDRGAKAKID